MRTFDEFVEREILPTLGEFADDYDVKGLADEVSEWDDEIGYTWKLKYLDQEEYVKAMREYDVSPEMDLQTENDELRRLGKDLYRELYYGGEWLEPFEPRARQLRIR